MTDPVSGTASSVPTDPADARASNGSAMPMGSGAGGALIPGRRWGNYQIGDALPGATNCFRATDVLSMEEVHICARPVQGDGSLRRQVWAQLEILAMAHLVPLREAMEDGGWRYEVYSLPAGDSLRDWIACHQIGLPEIERLVHQISVALEVLHDNGIVHLRVRPENIYIHEKQNQLDIALGGLAEATLHTQAELIPIEVDGYYAPPEAAGLYRHQSGPALGAWDWWGLGRVVQEAIHGSHVYGLLFERDVKSAPPELQPRVEAALRDRDPSGVRAGAVELLPDQVSPRARTLLRGLLASSRDGRWGPEQVQHWLQGATVPDRYDLPRDARLFIWRRRAFTLPEAADFFSQPDYAIEGQAQFFPLIDEPGTMRRFLEELPQFRAERDRVAQLLGLVDSTQWQHLPLSIRRAAASGLAWLSLASKTARPGLCVQRWKIDPPGLQEMFADAPPAEALNLARVLITPAYQRAVEALDPAAARAIAMLGEFGFAALDQASRHGWIAGDDPVPQSRLLRYALDSDKDLLARRDRLRMAYASNQDARLADLLAAAKPDRVSLMLLAFTGERAKEFGYVTHAEWDLQRAQRMHRRAAVLAGAVLWRRLGTIVRGSPAVLGPWPIFGAIWIVPVSLAFVGGLWWAAIGIAGSALGMRYAALARINSLLARFAPAVRSWSLRDRAHRCHDEAAAVLSGLPDTPPTAAAMLAEIHAVRAEIQTLKLKPALPLPPLPPNLTEFWLGAAASVVVPVAILVALFQFAAHVPETPPLAPRPSHSIVAQSKGAGLGLSELFEEFNDGFGRRLRGPLKPWDVPLSLSPRPALVRRMIPSTPDQRAYARVGAELLLEPYPREGLDVTLAVPVPVGDGWGILLYDSQRRDLADRRAFFFTDPLQERAWYWVGNRRVVYLGLPPRLPLQFTLAPP